MNCIPYVTIVGSLMYAMICTQPNICYAMDLVSHYDQSNLRIKHWKAAKRILLFLKGNFDHMLYYQGLDLSVMGYGVVDWASNLDVHKSILGYIFLLNYSAILQSRKKQIYVALSTMEVEFMGCSAKAQKVVWLRRFLQDLRVVACIFNLMTIYCDSMVSPAYMKDPKYHEKSKHIDIKYHYIHKIVKQKEVILEHLSTNRMVTNPLSLFTEMHFWLMLSLLDSVEFDYIDS